MADKRIRIELNVDEELGGLTRAQSALDQFSRRGTAAFGKLETHVAGLERAAAGLTAQFGRHLPDALSKLLTRLPALERSLGGLGRTLSQILFGLPGGGGFGTPSFNPNALLSFAFPTGRDPSSARTGASGIPIGGGLLDFLGSVQLRGLGPLSGGQLLSLGLSIGGLGFGGAGTGARTAGGALGGALTGLALGGPLGAGAGAAIGGLLGFLGLGRGKLKEQATEIANGGFAEIRRIFEEYKSFRRDFSATQAAMQAVWAQMVGAWQQIGGGVGERSIRDQRRYFDQILVDTHRIENERGIRGNIIRALPAPSFQHGGFSPGGGFALLHPGEFVLSSRAVERMGAALLQGLNSGGGVQAAAPGGGATLTIEPASAQHLADMFQRDPAAADRGLMAVVRSGGKFSRALRG